MILRSLLERRTNLSNPATPLTDPSLVTIFGGSPTASGETVSPEKSLQLSAVYSCVSLIAEAIASLPIHMYRKTGDYRRRVDDHPYMPLFDGQANPDHDSGEFWRAVLGGMLLYGNGYGFKSYDGNGRVTQLWPIPPNRVNPMRNPITGELFYYVSSTPGLDWEGVFGSPFVILRPEEMLHFRAFNLGGSVGLSPVGLARESIGLGLSAQKYGGGYFANDARPGGVLEVPGNLTDEAFLRLKNEWDSLHRGAQNAHKIAVLEGGTKWQQVGMSPVDSQFLETRKFSVNEICRLYGVPPHLAGDTDKSTSWGAGIEQQSIGFVLYTLRRWIVRLQNVVRTGMLWESDPNLYLKFSSDVLLRGDFKTRMEGYAIARQWGIYSANTILRKEDEEPLPGPEGDLILNPLNFGPAGTKPQPPTPPTLNDDIGQ